MFKSHSVTFFICSDPKLYKEINCLGLTVFLIKYIHVLSLNVDLIDWLISEHLQSEMSLSHAWEWREGRLFAYELIVKFLIINHIHYLFPSYALPPSKFDGSVSADDAVPHRYFISHAVSVESSQMFVWIIACIKRTCNLTVWERSLRLADCKGNINSIL